MVRRREGRRMRLASMAPKRVREVSSPRAKVPPKLDRQKMPKPKKRMMEVYIMLCPVSRRALVTERVMSQAVDWSSWRYLAR